MAEEETAPDWLQAVDFNSWSLARFVEEPDPEFLDLVHNAQEALGAFLATKTKAELYAGAPSRRLLLAPVSTASDIAEDEQLAARDYFRTVAHPHLGRDLVLPGAFVKFSASPAAALTPAPRWASTTPRSMPACWATAANDSSTSTPPDSVTCDGRPTRKACGA